MNLRGVLLDIEGVLHQGGEPIAGAVETVQRLRKSGVVLRFLTNVTTRPRRLLATQLAEMGFAAEQSEIFSPTLGAAKVLKNNSVERVHLAAGSNLAEDFSAFRLVEHNPQAVVLGDLYREFTWERLDALFRMLLDGAQLIALHKNRYCRRGDALGLDLGPFVAALEYAAGVSAVVVGKPAREFFAMALSDAGLKPEEAVMIGDDIEADIGGALAAGLRGVQVETGKYRPEDRQHRTVSPEAWIASIRDLPDWLERI